MLYRLKPGLQPPPADEEHARGKRYRLQTAQRKEFGLESHGGVTEFVGRTRHGLSSTRAPGPDGTRS